MHYGPHKATTHGGFGECGNRVDRRQRARRCLQSFGLRGDLAAEIVEEFCLELHDALFGAEHLLLPILQFRRRVSFSVRQRLPSFVIRRHARRVGF